MVLGERRINHFISATGQEEMLFPLLGLMCTALTNLEIFSVRHQLLELNRDVAAVVFFFFCNVHFLYSCLYREALKARPGCTQQF